MSESDESEFTEADAELIYPLVVITIYSDGQVSVAGRDDLTLEKAADVLHTVSHEIRDKMKDIKSKAKEN
jgi:hypothetical protein